MPQWMLPRITDYWDWQVDAIERLSLVLAETPERDRPAQIKLIGEAVTRHVDALDDHFLRLSAVALVEDLYKSANRLTSLDDTPLQYLQASAAPYFRALTRRGYTVHYFIDNTFSRLDGPALAFPLWFRAASLVYLCPQEIAATSFEKDKPQSDWPALVSKYSVDGRSVADELMDRCHKERRHFVYLDIDADGFPAAQKTSGAPGVIHVFRNEAPTPGSRIVVNMPSGPLGAEPRQPVETAPGSTRSTKAPDASASENRSDPHAQPAEARGGTSPWRMMLSFFGGSGRK
jgi:hypothetical protein